MTTNLTRCHVFDVRFGDRFLLSRLVAADSNAEKLASSLDNRHSRFRILESFFLPFSRLRGMSKSSFLIGMKIEKFVRSLGRQMEDCVVESHFFQMTKSCI